MVEGHESHLVVSVGAVLLEVDLDLKGRTPGVQPLWRLDKLQAVLRIIHLTEILLTQEVWSQVKVTKIQLLIGRL